MNPQRLNPQLSYAPDGSAAFRPRDDVLALLQHEAAWVMAGIPTAWTPTSDADARWLTCVDVYYSVVKDAVEFRSQTLGDVQRVSARSATWTQTQSTFGRVSGSRQKRPPPPRESQTGSWCSSRIAPTGLRTVSRAWYTSHAAGSPQLERQARRAIRRHARDCRALRVRLRARGATLTVTLCGLH